MAPSPPPQPDDAPADAPLRAPHGFWGVILAQFFGAFNDNAFKWFLQALALKTVSDPSRRDALIALAGALFLAPYLLFSMHAGCLSDRASKRTVLLWSKCAEAIVMGLAVVVFLLSDRDLTDGIELIALFVILFLLGIQATYYAPSKYGILPELLPSSLLSWGNGMLELTGFLAIILGTIAGAQFVDLFAGQYQCAALVFAAFALFGVRASLIVPRVPASAPGRPIRINPLPDLLRHVRILRQHRGLLFGLLGIVFVWSLGLLFQLNIAFYSDEHLGQSQSWLGYPMAVIAIGVGIGSYSASWVSGERIEIGLVYLGATGISASAAVLSLTSASPALTLLAAGVTGFFAGFLIVPLHAYVQAESPIDDKGGMMATANLLQTAGMFVTTGVFLLLHHEPPWGLGLSPAAIFLVAAAGTAVLTGLGIWLLPSTCSRFLLWLSAATRYRVSSTQHADLEAPGPLLVCGRGLSYSEALLALTATHRTLRLVYVGSTEPLPAIGIVGRLMGAKFFHVNGGRDLPPAAAAIARESIGRGEGVVLVRELPDGAGDRTGGGALGSHPDFPNDRCLELRAERRPGGRRRRLHFVFERLPG